jgi:enoyl-CoA hydratase/carnithine racemase
MVESRPSKGGAVSAAQTRLVLEELEDGLLTVVLNRPDRRNALNSELYLTSPILTARQAVELGVVTRVVADDQLDAAATELASGPTATFGHIKANPNLAEHAGLAECLDNEAWRHTACMTTADHREAAAAFVEKRPPRFQGK